MITPQEIQAYIDAGTVLVSAGVQLGGKVKQLIELFHGADHGLTNDEIAALETASIAESARRQAARDQMAAPDPSLPSPL